jgi:hypothetical protein
MSRHDPEAGFECYWCSRQACKITTPWFHLLRWMHEHKKAATGHCPPTFKARDGAFIRALLRTADPAEVPLVYQHYLKCTNATAVRAGHNIEAFVKNYSAIAKAAEKARIT